TVDAPFDRAEGVRVEPYQAGRYFARLAESTSPATATPPADRQLPAEGGSAQSSQAQQPDESAIADPAPVSASAADVGDRAGAATAATETAGTQPKERRGTRGPLPTTTERIARELKDGIKKGRYAIQDGRLFEGLHRASRKKLMAAHQCGKSTLLN